VGGTSYEEVPASALEPGDVTVVLEGERLPADGVIEGGDGIALLYPRAPRPARAAVGDFLLAGTQVTEGALTVRAQRTGRNRTLAHMLRLKVERAPGSSGLARARRLLAQWGWVPFVAAAVVCAATAGVANAGVLLLGLPALALVAAIDTPLDSAALSAARRGMFFGDEAALLDAGRVQTTAILLRGALTAGEPVVQQVQTLGSTDVEYAVGLAAAAERITPEHPIARAILRYAEEHGIAEAALRKERHHAGLGITAISRGGRSVAVGRRQLLLNEGVSVAAADEEAKHIENEGLTPIFVAVDGSLEALLAVLDPTHVGAPDAVRRLAELPSEVVILSGDDRRTVERIAQQLGASRVKAPLLPKERALEVRALKETGGVTAAIGRGGEDDAVLAAADVPVSIRLVGTATEQRGVVAAGRDVRDAADALWIAHAARRSVGRALLATLVLGAVVSAGAWLGWLTPPLAIALAIGIEVWTLRAGSRLLRRVDLRVPMQQ
jgi:cation transport ATPase